HPGHKQDRFRVPRIAGAAVPYQVDVADAVRGLGHAPGIYASEPASARETRAQREHGLRVELGDPRFGDPEDLADLAEGQALVVVEGDDDALALGQGLDRVGEAVLELGRLRLDLGVGRVRIAARVQHRDLAAALG